MPPRLVGLASFVSDSSSTFQLAAAMDTNPHSCPGHTGVVSHLFKPSSFFHIKTCTSNLLFCLMKACAVSWQSFSRPMVVLSLATAVTNVYKEIQRPDTSGQNLSSLRQRHHYSRDTIEIEPKEEEIIVADEQADSLHLLKRELESKGILIPER
jgi:hypothetical protein